MIRLFARKRKSRAPAYRMNRWKGLRAILADNERDQVRRSHWRMACRRIARAACLLACASIAIYGGVAVVRESGPVIQRGLEIRDVQIQGVRHVSKQEVLERLALRNGIALHEINLSYLAERLRTIAWIKEATVERLPLHTLRVTVLERKPAAIVLIGSDHYLADDEGALLTRLGERDDPALPLLTGADLKPLLVGELHVRHTVQSSIELARAMAHTVEGRVEINLSNPMNLVASMKGMRFQFGSDGLIDQWNRFQMVKAAFRTAAFESKKRDGGEIDLRYDNRVIVRERG